MTNWIYKGKEITCLEDIDNYEKILGFVYIIERKASKKYGPHKIYIGKKILHHSRKTRITKKEKLLTPTRRVFKRVVKESDWKLYWGSCDPLKADMKVIPQQYFTRTILEFCFSKKQLAYSEIEYQFKQDVLRKDTYNGNILGKYFRKDLINESI